MKITILDKSQFKAETSCNGGNYSFSVIYRQVNDDQFEVLHSTSSEFTYCELCGSFFSGDSCPCGMEGPDIVDLETVNREISCAMRKYAQGEEWEIIISE